jgi:hypothetical protein
MLRENGYIWVWLEGYYRDDEEWDHWLMAL